MDKHKAWYRDDLGELEGFLYIDPDGFALEIGGVRFEDSSPDSLEPVSHTAWADPGRFRLHHNALCGCELAWSQPMQLLHIEDGHITQHALQTKLRLGYPDPVRGGLDGEELWLGLEHEGQLVEGRAGFYEEALSAIARALPAGHHLRCCWGCDLSDYSPYGQGLIGSMMCFVEHAAAYRAIDDTEHIKPALFDLIERAQPLTFVAETHVCDRFAPRRTGAGYRG
jgi:hypothetical protein